jgi:hypothetical protein
VIAALVFTVMACGAPEDTGSPQPDGASGPVVLASGPATVGIAWTVIDGQWVGLGSRTLTADDPPNPLSLDVVVQGETTTTLAGAGGEVAVQAPTDVGLAVTGSLDTSILIEGQDGVERVIDVARSTLDVVLAPGELYRAALPVGTDGQPSIDLDAGNDARVRCEGRFDHT